MDKSTSRKYLTSLSAEERKKLAESVKVSQEYLYMIGAGDRTPSRRVAAMLERETDGRVKAVDFDNEAMHAIKVA